MYVLSFHSLLPHSITAIIFFLLTSSPPVTGNLFSTCNSTHYNCGEIKDIGYPFWGGDRPQACGYLDFQLTCDENTNHTTMIINSFSFRVFDIDVLYNYTMKIARSDLFEDECPDKSISETKLSDGPYLHFPDMHKITLHFGCNSSFHLPPEYSSFGFECNEDGVEKFGFFEDDNSVPRGVLDPYEESCESRVEVPISEIKLTEVKGNKTELLKALSQGIPVVYNGSYEYCFACEKSNGICWSGTNTEEPTCLCYDRTYPYYCGFDHKKGNNVGMKIGIGIGGAAFAFIVCFCWFAYHKRQKKQRSVSSSYLMSRSVPSNPSSSTIDLEGGSNYHGVPLFDYTELEEATNNFDPSNELGDGGFGTVYKGKLRDGRVVAVKRLYENNYKRVEQFMTEIEILAQKRHKNLVTLYGCTSRNSRELLLVYEYVPNGTIADHLHGERARPRSMCWATRLSIAVETASALAYLHLSDVIHRDVKTNNILLDNNFCVKVADFGLSRLFPTHVTHVSTAPQGTPGYVDPEYHECYQLTSKSDVYSFGVVLIELISSLPAVDITRHRHEINLSNMAINKIQCNALHELVDKNLGFESDAKVREMISAVAELAFRCLQSGKDMRPTMPEVLERLVEIQNMDSTGKTDSHSKRSPTDSSVLLLKNNEAAALSPNSVITAQWSSRSTTNSSSSC